MKLSPTFSGLNLITTEGQTWNQDDHSLKWAIHSRWNLPCLSLSQMHLDNSKSNSIVSRPVVHLHLGWVTKGETELTAPNVWHFVTQTVAPKPIHWQKQGNEISSRPSAIEKTLISGNSSIKLISDFTYSLKRYSSFFVFKYHSALSRSEQ